MNPDQAWSLPPREHCTLASSCPLTPWGRFAGFLARPHHRHNHRIRNSGLTPASNLAELRLLGYDAQALTITAVRHLFILFADLLAAISMLGLFVILCLIFQGARAVAAVETEPSPTLSCGPELRP